MRRSAALPKIDRSWQEAAKMKSEERADARRGTPGFWHQNPPFKPLYIPGWMVQAEEQAKAWGKSGDGPALVKIGPFWETA